MRRYDTQPAVTHTASLLLSFRLLLLFSLISSSSLHCNVAAVSKAKLLKRAENEREKGAR